jgi:N-acetyl-anhydromuramyl-L-alanine amidase AmpD
MEVKWIGSPNYGYPDGTQGRNGYRPIGVVLHIAEGTLAGCDAWFNSPNNPGSSTHYCIGKNGAIHQYVEESDAAWGNGQVKQPTWPLLKEGVNPNLYTISIEHEGYTGEPWTEEMYQADVWLVRQICERWEIAIDRDHIIGHYRIDSVNRARCPGTGLPWDRLLADLKRPAPIEDQVRKLQQQVAELQAKLASIGRLVKTTDSAQVYLLKEDVLYPIANVATLELLYSPTLVEVVSAAEIAGLQQGGEIDVA